MRDSTDLSASPSPKGALPDVLRPAAGAARAFAEQAKAENTKRAYRADWRCFRSWCGERGLDALPADPRTVTLYVADKAAPSDGSAPLKVSTLERRLSAISQAHRMSGLPSPASTREEPLHSVWAGLVRTKGRAKDKVAPALTPDVVAMVEALPTVELLDGSRQLTTAAKRDRALLLVGFAGALRRSELAALTVADLGFGADGMRLRLRRSKADQEGEGATLGLHYGDRPLSCPVRAVQDWIRHIAITEGPVFRSVDRHGNVSDRALDSGSVARIVKRAASRAGLDPAAYSGHSLRAGFATQAARAGAHERAIMRHTRHKSERVLREYIRDGQLFDENPSDALGL
ncbi:MAG: integrase [Pimelobacter sp.]|nr:integrase [Pimelobacter sp.]